ncbi:Transposable element Tcb1 transposase [Labeo rohita]|uniref:Transposable element Tcb1 transposase n=1 Tax=Labeo rohita TaxID=84645 RepID=A0ABQ8LCJ4_LABRO|nr:Transposable element Tcb1 transposase [Labeo rohita]
MVSQFGSLGYTIMGKTADLTVVQKTIIDTLHKEGKPQTFIAKEAGCSQSAASKHVNRKLSGRRKCGRKTRENCSLERLVKQNQFKNLGELHMEWTEAGVKASRATTHRRVKEFDESKFCISFGNQGPRVWRKGGEAHSPSCLKSSVKFPHKLTKPEPHRESMGYYQEENENKRPKNADELKATVKETWASIPPQQCHRLITSMPRRIEAEIKAKGAPTNDINAAKLHKVVSVELPPDLPLTRNPHAPAPGLSECLERRGLFERRVGSLPRPTVAGGGLVTIEKHCHAAIAMTGSGSEDCVLVQKDAAFCLSHRLGCPETLQKEESRRAVSSSIWSAELVSASGHREEGFGLSEDVQTDNPSLHSLENILWVYAQGVHWIASH